MIETQLLAGSIDNNTSKIQNLPSQQSIARFDTAMSQTDNSVQAPTIGSISPLSIIDPNSKLNVDNLDSFNTLGSHLLSEVSTMNQQYSHLLNKSQNGFAFKDYLDEIRGDDIRSYPAISDGASLNGNDHNQRAEALLEKTRENMEVSLAHSRDMADYSKSFNLWMAKASIVASAVKQVAQGFKTLFRAGG